MKIAEKIAKDCIFDGVSDPGIMYRGLHVFEPYIETKEGEDTPCVGLPQFILLDDEGNEQMKNISYEETFEICRLFPDYDDEEEEEEEEE